MNRRKNVRIQLYIYICLLYFISVLPTNAQDRNQTWTLDQCIEYALKHNFTIQQTNLQSDKAAINLKSAKNNYLPEIVGKGRNIYNWGLFVDPATNLLTTQSSEIYTGSVEGELTLFNGGYNYYTLKQNRDLLNATISDNKKVSNDITLSIIGAFYQVLFAQEQIKITNTQKDQSRIQYELIKGMVDKGVLSKINHQEIESEVAQRDAAITIANSNMQRSQLALKQLLAYTDGNLDLANEDKNSIPDSLQIEPYEEIKEKACIFLPEIKSAQYRLNALQYRSQATNSLRLFNFSVSGGVITRSSNLVQLEQKKQFKQNLTEYVSFNLAVPIFSKFLKVNALSLSKIDIDIQKKELDKVNLEVEQKIQAAYLDLVTAHNNFKALDKKTKAFQAQYNYASKSYSSGIINYIEYYYAANMLVTSQLEQLIAEYDFYLKRKTLEFYEGKGYCQR
ncbi:TolC family protein [Sporocytophaga myxococcoides]|uniref:TolC family protein n=1 Tax=Sporocytophaga myxococcoides TaxID=153721 RepID=UPI0009DC008F|nr:TolC family protein [Sporocytophaga myxococcoides]